MGANMRCLVLVCSVFALVCATSAADAQAQQQPVKRTSARQKAAQKSAPAPMDTRPRYKRDDTPAAVSATAPEKPGTPQRRVARKHRSVVQPDATPVAGRSTPRDVAACSQVKDSDAAIAGCTRVIEDAKQKPK